MPGWRAIFSFFWGGVFAFTLLVAVLLGGTGGGRAFFFAGAATGEAILAIGSYLLLERYVVRPVERLRKDVAAGDGDSLPATEGPLAPLAEAISGRLDRSVATLREAVRAREETQASLESGVQYLRTIAEVSTAIAGTLDPEELYRIIPERVMRRLDLNDFCIMLYNGETKKLVAKASSGGDPKQAPPPDLSPGEGIAGKVFLSGEAAWVPDVQKSPEIQYFGWLRRDVRSLLCVPLQSKGKSIGVLMLHHLKPDAFKPELLPTMRVLASYLAIAMENAELFGFVKSLAEKDSLTLLYNHGAFHEKLAIELERASRYNRSMAVIMLDLDGFKEINDTYGHITGDRVLALVAGALGAHLRRTDIAARYGGDEFAVILPETDLASAAVIAGRIGEGIAAIRMDVDRGNVVSFTASIGYAVCGPESTDRDQILGIADRLMYDSKRRGRGGVLGMQI
ncbi:MAG: diguanylate cyclase [Deltaproteobacteria bacterium]|nr:diguanylate cyclase [Deltaproteobacteria bacterium]